MRQIVAAAMIALAAPAAHAGDWLPMTGPQIAETLTDQTLLYELGDQRFFASGRTRYTVGRESWGWWEVRDDRYCSLWPPQDDWGCYRMEISAAGDLVRFIGAAGDITEGLLER